MEAQNRPWSLESFVDALVVELDKTRETLAVKAVNKPLTYTVKDMALDLQIFPTYDGDQVKFVTARPGEQGASKVSIKLDSITDQVVRATTKKLPSKDDTSIDKVEEIDEGTKKELRKIGVTSIKDLEDLEKKNVDIGKVNDAKINYTNLANIIQKTKRNTSPPKVNKVSMSMENGKPVIIVEGKNLAVRDDFMPVAVINEQVADVLSFDDKQLKIDVSGKKLEPSNALVVALDPYSVFKVNLKNKES
jgi:hypothetical protein